MNKLNLPIYDVIEQICFGIENGKNIILQAEPGAGKSTAVPLALLSGAFFTDKKIVMLQPRRVAAKSITYYLSTQLGEDIGQTVGYRIRNETKVSDNTRLEIVTEGVLTQMIQNDPELDGVGLIIFDEFHERSLHADISLMLVKEVQQSLRDDLRVCVMSATLDTDLLETYLDNTETISVKGTAYPVSVDYLRERPRTIESSVLAGVKTLLANTSGDILVFLPGVKEINQCLEMAKHHIDSDTIDMLMLHGTLGLFEQQRVLQARTQGQRKIIFSTNIAETSLTIPNITGVVDSGLERKMVFEPNSGMSRLVTKKISLASAEQRKGRAGRTQHGQCVRLWRESENGTFEKYHQADIVRSDLTDVIMQLAKWGNTDFDEIDWITAPPKAHFNSTVSLLQSLGLLTSSGTITQLGHVTLELGIPVRLAKMIAMVSSSEHKKIACRLAAILSERDFLFSNDSADLMLRFNMLDTSISQLKARHVDVNIAVLSGIKELERSLSQKVRQFSSAFSSPALAKITDIASVVACLVLFAFPERLALRRGKETNRYQLANGKGVKLKPHDPLCRHELLVVCNCDLREREGVVFSAIPIDLSLVKDVFETSLTIKNKNIFDPNNGRFFAQEGVFYQSIKLANKGQSDAEPDFIGSKIKELVAQQKESLFHWTSSCESWVKRLVWLSSIDNEFPKITKQSLFDKADEWLVPYIGKIKRLQELKKVDVLSLIKASISWELQSKLEKAAPEYYCAPSGRKVKIDYDSDQGPKVSIILQEVFGELTSPKLANKVNLRFELLSPAKRPIQITSDIGQFWHSSYAEVAKDMRSKYPKHRWPTEPLKEKAGRSMKAKTSS